MQKQKTALNRAVLFLKEALHLFLVKGVRRDFKTFRLINNAYLQGLFM